jgi:hypothetical protein
MQRLLDRLAGEAGGQGEPTESHWELPILPPPDPEGRLSSTDLLGWWFRGRGRGPRAQGRGGWDDYFASEEDGAPEEVPEPEVGPPASREDEGGDLPPFPEARDAGLAVSSLFPDLEEQLADEHAQAAVDCLYELIHAFGRRDVDAAMQWISEAYHALEDDQEIDRLTFRHGLEAGLEGLKKAEISVSLAQAPEPLSHPEGILIDAQVQIEVFHPEDDSRDSLVERRIAVLVREADNQWRIRSFGKVPR